MSQLDDNLDEFEVEDQDLAVDKGSVPSPPLDLPNDETLMIDVQIETGERVIGEGPVGEAATVRKPPLPKQRRITRKRAESRKYGTSSLHGHLANCKKYLALSHDPGQRPLLIARMDALDFGYMNLDVYDNLEKGFHSMGFCGWYHLDPNCIALPHLVMPILWLSFQVVESTVFVMLNSMGLVNAPHRCPIPVVDDPNTIVIPKRRSPDKFVQSLSYVLEDKMAMNGSQSVPLFGGHETWKQRDESFKVKPTMKVHCGFMKNSGAEMDSKDRIFVKKCQFVVASGIFDSYDTPLQPSNISEHSRKLFCFLMVVDEVSYKFIKENVTVKEDEANREWVGIWRLILLKHPPYDEPRRNGKVPKILTHRLFPEAQYSIWIDGKMELVVDPLLILERYLWREKHMFAIAQHKHHRSIYEEADSNKRRKRYARPLIDLHIKIYRYEGLEPWNPKKNSKSGITLRSPGLSSFILNISLDISRSDKGSRVKGTCSNTK
ncbi:OLC1v1035291C2 [Oldenlandia corymbosa var. corymbosa]|uniref:OLC1v1035291C2 n=1 Tax=Oldenlandia corymbosa var. corymbosa TaxID=529605 RepID=A0AAV1CTD5_OLDCO|nr:OLC1v1035291C2 [Oldenlandia corymbosa var. corymbosa]